MIHPFVSLLQTSKNPQVVALALTEPSWEVVLITGRAASSSQDFQTAWVLHWHHDHCQIYLYMCIHAEKIYICDPLSHDRCVLLYCASEQHHCWCFFCFFTACQSLGFAIKWWFKKKNEMHQCVHWDDHIGGCCQQIVEISKSIFQIGSWKERSSLPCSMAVAKTVITKPCGFLNFLKCESCSV